MTTDRRARWLAAIICAMAVTAFARDAEPALTIFTIAAFPVAEPDAAIARVVAVDQVHQLSRALSAGMPPGRESAIMWLRERLNSAEGKDFLAALGPATEALVLAWSWSVRALPAVVLEDGAQRYVVYGTTDASLALQLWRQHALIVSEPVP